MYLHYITRRHWEGGNIWTTVDCRYNAVQYNVILYTSLRWLGHNMDVSLNPQMTPYISP